MTVLKNVLRLTYEELTDYPARTARRLVRCVPLLGRLDPKVREVPGIDDLRRNGPIVNMNRRNTLEEIRRINRVLRRHEDLLKFHGYELIDA